MRQIAGCSLVVLALAAMALAGCRKKAPPPIPQNVTMIAAATVPADAAAATWQSAPEYVAKLLPQDMVEPRLLQASTAEVRVRAIHDGVEVAFRLEWADATVDDQAAGARFCDGCAIQWPAKIEPNVPAPQMGEIGHPVEIAFWNAGWQATFNGRGDSIKDIYPNAVVDHYPFEAASLPNGSAAQTEMATRYAPARALGNAMAGPRSTPVQDLVAEGPGTLASAAATTSKGNGQRSPAGWTVVITRRLPAGMNRQTPTQIAFAVWEGSQQEVGARKMRSVWVPLVMQGGP
ncbi:MAG: hypothetical protein A3K19_06520 [Lentisphaerae bacterium RIFOXYB12_FULL_65_16]|nr:MAG: hypothetical protein A3K18_02120 [Lentisphaerae bacterium RIFOXYA12_64_32]OGV93093.1 MAG: hypothetical protein A3K19_06520 [Lentisphaerae bacterium RIFOXYB12_FULL_65_16]